MQPVLLCDFPVKIPVVEFSILHTVFKLLFPCFLQDVSEGVSKINYTHFFPLGRADFVLMVAEKQKRISALNRLTKQQQMLLYTEVIGFITRYLELSAAFDTIEAVISELDYHQSAMKGKNGVTLPQSAYV